VNDDQWWATREAIFDRYFDPALHPTMIAVEQDGGFAPPADSDEYHCSALWMTSRLVCHASSMVSRRSFGVQNGNAG